MASAKTRTCSEGCRFASLQTPLICGHNNTGGLKAPGYSCSRLSDVFSLIVHLFVATNMWTKKTEGLKAPGYSYSRLSDVFSLTTHYSLLITRYPLPKAHHSKLYILPIEGEMPQKGQRGSSTLPILLLHHHRPRPCLEWDRA